MQDIVFDRKCSPAIQLDESLPRYFLNDIENTRVLLILVLKEMEAPFHT